MARMKSNARQQKPRKHVHTEVKKKIVLAAKQHENLISSNLSSKILKEALIQQKEIFQEEEELCGRTLSDSEHENAEGSDNEDDDFCVVSETLSGHGIGVEEIDEDDEKALAAFLPGDAGPQTLLTNLILQKIKEKDAKVPPDVRRHPVLDNSIIDLYNGVGSVLSKYTTGKFPKVLQRIASMKDWEKVLYITNPEQWSPNAVYQATRIFTSRLKENATHHFSKSVLLPRVRYEIQKNKKLHPAIYEALKKTAYKPYGFFQGILLPLCKSRTCTRVEAIIIGSIIEKVSIAVRASSAALLTLTALDYHGPTSYFMKLLIEKKYVLRYEVLDGIVEHFMRFLEEKSVMPVVWHQTLLSFAQRYKHELTKEDKDNLNRLMQHQKHPLITPEICRELKNSRNRGENKSDLSQRHLVSAVRRTIEEDRWDFPEVPMEED